MTKNRHNPHYYGILAYEEDAGMFTKRAGCNPFLRDRNNTLETRVINLYKMIWRYVTDKVHLSFERWNLSPKENIRDIKTTT